MLKKLSPIWGCAGGVPIPASEQLPPADRGGGRGGRTSGQHLQDPVLLCLQQSPRRQQRPLSRSLLRFASRRRRRRGQRPYSAAAAQSAAAADRSPLGRKSAKHPSAGAVRPAAAAVAAAKFIRCRRRVSIRHVFLFVADRFAVYFRRPAGGQRRQRWLVQPGSWTAAIGRHHGQRRRPSEPWRQRRREYQSDPRRQQRRGGSGRACEPSAAAAL
jgi:hypothetical protein